MPVTLRVILGPDDAMKLTLCSGIPQNIDELKNVIKTECGIDGDFRMQYLDTDFNEFMNLTSTSGIDNKATIKIISMSSDTAQSIPHCLDSSPRLSSADNYILSSPETTSSTSCSTPSLRYHPWPKVFVIPKFTYEAEMQLEMANQAFRCDGSPLSLNPKLKSDILDGLKSEIIKYKMYPTSTEYDDVAKALIETHPCLKERGSASGYYSWKTSLKYKMLNYRAVLRNLGCPELMVNSLKQKRDHTRSGPNQVKKPRRAEINYYPAYPVGQTKDSMEQERQSLLVEVKKRNNYQVIKQKMEITFAYRRQEVIENMPFIAEFKERWPALFTEREINAEFSRITTVPLLSTFMSQLDIYSSRLRKVFRKKGGVSGSKISAILAVLDKNPTIEVSRRSILEALVVYLNEDPQCLVKEYLDVDPYSEKAMEQTVIGIYGIKNEGADVMDPLETVGIIIEGVDVLPELGDIACACALLFGLMYCLDLSYPKNLKHTFEALQKIIMELDGSKLSHKVQVLKNKLLELDNTEV